MPPSLIGASKKITASSESVADALVILGALGEVGSVVKG